MKNLLNSDDVSDVSKPFCASEARFIAQIGLGWSWLLCLDGLIVAGSFAEVPGPRKQHEHG